MGEHATTGDGAYGYGAERAGFESAREASRDRSVVVLAAFLLMTSVAAVYALFAAVVYVIIANAGWRLFEVGSLLVIVLCFALFIGLEVGQLQRRRIRDLQRALAGDASLVEDDEFESLLEQVRDLRRRTDEITRLHESIRAELQSTEGTSQLPAEQRELAQKVVETLSMPRISPKQTRHLYETYFGYH